MLEQTVTIFPQDPSHRLVGPDLATFLDRVSERMAALGDGALATVEAGRYSAEPHHLPALLAAIDEARERGKGKHDLDVRIRGDARERFYRFLGNRSIDLRFRAFVQPQELGAILCEACGHPLDHDRTSGGGTCCRSDCGDTLVGRGDLTACWCLQLIGQGADGIGERFVLEGRRLEGTPFLEALQGAARSRLFEWHSWR